MWTDGRNTPVIIVRRIWTGKMNLDILLLALPSNFFLWMEPRWQVKDVFPV
jgi:hypothetical protein